MMRVDVPMRNQMFVKALRHVMVVMTRTPINVHAMQTGIHLDVALLPTVAIFVLMTTTAPVWASAAPTVVVVVFLLVQPRSALSTQQNTRSR